MRGSNSKVLPFILIAFFIPSLLFPASFDKGGVLGVGARSIGQAGAVVARGDGTDALWWNPAGIYSARNFAFGVHYGNLLGGKNNDLVVGHRGFVEEAGFSYGLGYRNYTSKGPFKLTESTVLISGAIPFSDDERVVLGATAKFYATKLDIANVEAGGTGFDVGLIYTPPVAGDMLVLGLSVIDFQSSLNWSTGFEVLPPQLFLVGVAWKMDEATSFELDLEVVQDARRPSQNSIGTRVGAERWIDIPAWGLENLFAVRVGYLQSDAVEDLFTAGLGVEYGEFGLDYAYQQGPSRLGISHRVSVNYEFGLSDVKAKTKTKTPTPGPSPSPTPGPIVENAIKVIIEAEPPAFSPGSGLENSNSRLKISIAGDAGEVKNWYATITDEEGNPVIKLPVRKTRKPPEDLIKPLKWDGRANKTPVKPGKYTVRVFLLNDSEKVVAQGSVVVTVTEPRGDASLQMKLESEVFAPGGLTARGEAVFITRFGAGAVSSWEMSFTRQGSAKPVRVLKGTSAPSSIKWNGRDSAGNLAPDGKYMASLVVVSADGSKMTDSKQVTIDTRRPGISLETGLDVFIPGEDSGALGIFATVAETAGLPEKWVISVDDIKGETVKTFKGPGLPPARLSWNGLDAKGQPVGYGQLFYLTYTLTMESGAMVKTPRQSVGSSVQPFQEANAISVPLATLLFEAKEDTIELDQFKLLKEAAAAVKAYGTEFLVQLKGHADEIEMKDAAMGAAELSTLRARNAREYLIVNEGLDPAKVVYAGYGTSRAVEGDGSLEHAAKNRRVEVILFTK